MKKVFILLLILLTSCTFKEDYFELGIGDYAITVGYDDSEYMKIAYNYELKDELEPYETVNDVNLYLFDDLLGVADFTNDTKKTIPANKAKLSKLTVYLNDLSDKEFKLNGEVLQESIKSNCEKYNGTYIEKNGYACVIENKVGKDLNVVELYGDYLAIDQDKLDHISIYVK